MKPARLSPRSYAQAARHLAALDQDWARHIETVGACRHETKPDWEPYEALVRAIAHQQLHARAAEAILGRLLALYPGTPFPSPDQLLATDPDLQRSCGFSAAKLATIRAIAQATREGIVPGRAEALQMDDASLIACLTSLRGIGRWTVEMFLIYSLARADILPVDDYGVREGYRRLKRLEKLPTPRQMREIGASWSPYRTVAAWYLWRVPSRAQQP